MKDLIADLEAAEAGSRELSDRVLLACGWEDIGAGYWTAPAPTPAMVDARYRPDPARSIDDAVALVPGNTSTQLETSPNGRALAILFEAHPSNDKNVTECFGATLPLAICIARLRYPA